MLTSFLLLSLSHLCFMFKQYQDLTEVLQSIKQMKEKYEHMAESVNVTLHHMPADKYQLPENASEQSKTS